MNPNFRWLCCLNCVHSNFNVEKVVKEPKKPTPKNKRNDSLEVKPANIPKRKDPTKFTNKVPKGRLCFDEFNT